MAGSWRDRSAAGQPLKPGDLGQALHDLQADVARLALLIAQLGGLGEGLEKRVAALEAAPVPEEKPAAKARKAAP